MDKQLPSLDGSAPRAIVFERWHPAGGRRLRVTSDGRLDYEETWGESRRTLRGRVRALDVARVLEALDRTSFPEEPQATLPPGNTVCKITIEPNAQSVFVDYHSALKMDGYRDAVLDLDGLSVALKAGDMATLEKWQFHEESAAP